jgi:hypothetical protein
MQSKQPTRSRSKADQKLLKLPNLKAFESRVLEQGKTSRRCIDG